MYNFSYSTPTSFIFILEAIMLSAPIKSLNFDFLSFSSCCNQKIVKFKEAMSVRCALLDSGQPRGFVEIN